MTHFNKDMKLIKTLIILPITLPIILSCGANSIEDMCANKISKEIASPNKKLKAVILCPHGVLPRMIHQL